MRKDSSQLKNKLPSLYFFQLEIILGTTRLFPVEPGTSNLEIQFVTDNFGRGPGFEMIIKEISCFHSDDIDDGYGVPQAEPVTTVSFKNLGKKDS